MPPWSQGEAREGEAGSRRQPSEGGKRSCSPSEVSMWEISVLTTPHPHPYYGKKDAYSPDSWTEESGSTYNRIP